MIDAIVVAGLLTLNIYIAWRYSKMPVESDFGIFAMWGMTGAVYGRDFVDCKSPGVHIWLMLLAKIIGYDYGKYRNVAKVNNFVVYKRY